MTKKEKENFAKKPQNSKNKKKTDSNKNNIIASIQHAKENSIAIKHFLFILTNLNVLMSTNTAHSIFKMQLWSQNQLLNLQHKTNII